jgi:hypothetical protein
MRLGFADSPALPSALCCVLLAGWAGAANSQHGNAIFAATLTVLATILTLLALRVSQNFAKLVGISGRQNSKERAGEDVIQWTLESLPVSPFVEKLRWCMCILEPVVGPFREEKDVGIAFLLRSGARSVPTLRFESGWAESAISNSTEALRFLYGRVCSVRDGGEDPADAKFELRLRAERFLRPTSRRLELEEAMDNMGHAIQRWYYYHLLASEGGKHAWRVRRSWGGFEREVPWWQRRIVQPLLLPLQRAIIFRIMRLADPAAGKKAFKIIDDTFTRVDEVLRTRGSADDFLCRLSDDDAREPSFVDVTWASMAGLCLLADDYGGGSCDDSLVPRSEVDQLPELKRDMETLARHPSAEFARRMLKRYRRVDLGEMVEVKED